MNELAWTLGTLLVLGSGGLLFSMWCGFVMNAMCEAERDDYREEPEMLETRTASAAQRPASPVNVPMTMEGQL